MSVRSRLVAANVERSSVREEAEILAGESTDPVIQGVVKSNGSDGTIIETQNGGLVTIPRRPDGAQNVTPTVGGVYQASVNGGTARLNINSRQKEQPVVQSRTGRVFWEVRSPISGQDFGNPGDLWADMQGLAGGYDRVAFWAWSQPLGRYVRINGADESNGEIATPTAGLVITAVTEANYPSMITGIYLSVGEVTATVNAGVATFSTSDVRSAGTTTTNAASVSVIDSASILNTIYLSKGIGARIDTGENLYLLVSATGGKPLAWTINYVIL